MNSLGHSAGEARTWGTAGLVSVAVHIVAGLLVLGLVRQADPPVPDPVMLVELPPPGPESAVLPNPQPPSLAQPQPAVRPNQPVPKMDVPIVRTPVPADTPIVQRIEPQRLASPAPVVQQPQPVRTPAPASGSHQAGVDPAAQKVEADYKSLVGSYIRRNRFSPPQSKKEGLSGDVKVRFVVDRRGTISSVSVAGSSGHGLLDSEAVSFIQRLTPVPAFPRDLNKAEIPLTITLKFNLERK